ncbi:AraC family transcriptional regulator [Mucilaginibacter paludis]
MSIRDVALFVGYSSTSSFSKAFKKHFDYKPSQIRDRKKDN